MTPSPSDNRPTGFETPMRVHPEVEFDFAGGLTADQRAWPVGGFERVERPAPELAFDFSGSDARALVLTVRAPEGQVLDPVDVAELFGALDTLRRKGYRVERQPAADGIE